MLLDLSDVLHRSGQVITREVRLEPGHLDEVELAEAVCGEIQVQNARRNLIVSGEARTAVMIPCARCLNLFPCPLQLTLEAVAPLSLFQLEGQGNATGAQPEKEEDELDDEIRALIVDHCLNVDELVRQAIWLQMPIKPLCSVDCQGLAEESAAGEMSDPRLDQLKNWPAS